MSETGRQWKVTGVDRDSGHEASLVVRASSAAVARVMAERRGILVAEVFELEPEHAEPGDQSTPSAGGDAGAVDRYLQESGYSRPRITSPRPGGDPASDAALASAESSALVLAWLGLVIWPLAIVGWIWGSQIMVRSAGRYGGSARTTGMAITIIGVVLFLLLVCSGTLVETG